MADSNVFLLPVAETLDGLDVAMCVFDRDDCTLLWNRAFLRFFPEHADNICAGEPYCANLRRFYEGRLDADEIASIDRYIEEGIARHHQQQQRPYTFKHRGKWLKAASIALPGGRRVRVWSRSELPRLTSTEERAAGLHAPPVADDTELFEQVGDSAMLTNAANVITRVNEHFVRMYELSDKDAAVGRQFEDVYNSAWRGYQDEDRVRYEAGMATLKESRRFAGPPFELSLPGARWVRVIEQRRRDGVGFFAHVDISVPMRQQQELILAERRARESQSLLGEKSRVLEATLERMEQGVMMVNAQRVVEVCNRRAIELLGLPPELMASRPTFSQVLQYQWSTDEFAHTPEDVREFVRAGGILDQPQCYERVRPNGRMIEVQSVPILGGGVLRTYTDITERQRGEQALRESEERLKRALDASRLALWDLDLNSGEIYLSEAWSEMLGGERAVTRTTFAALTATVPDEDQGRIAAAMQDALRGVTPSYSVEHQVRTPDGQTLWVLSQGRVVERSADGHARRAVGTNRDVTERKRAEATQRVLESQLREAQKLQAIGTLAGGIAHDFNNIMAAILGNVAFARQDLNEDHSVQFYLEQINKAGMRARSLVQQILAFSHRQPSEFITTRLRPILEETISMLQSTVSSSVKVHAVLPDVKLAVMANPTQLQQVLLNLGTNAWHALPDGVGRIEIGLEERVFDGSELAEQRAGRVTGHFAHLWVRDNGHGMDEATRQRIFEPFFTTKPVGQGTGLGLAVAHGIIEAHGGVIEVTSVVGEGSTFDLYLPLIDHQTERMPLEPSDTVPSHGAGQHVLYVDDDEVMALMVQGLLQRLGYRSTINLNAGEAVAIVARDPAAFDLVVTDFNMPNLSGLDVARALARIRPELPVAISSGFVSDELRTKAHELGVVAVMQKERTLEELGALVHSALSRAHGR